MYSDKFCCHKQFDLSCVVCSDLELTYGDAVIEGSHLVLKDIIATGKVPSTTGMVSYLSSNSVC